MKNKPSFEEAIRELEIIVTNLEKDTENIDEAIELHKKAMEKLEECKKILGDAGQKIEEYQRES